MGFSGRKQRRSSLHCSLRVALLVAGSVARAADRPACALTPANLQENAKLSFDDFDQKGTTPSTWRALSNHDCEAQAAIAAEDYLVHAMFASVRIQKNVQFHLAQSLAKIGRNDSAAVLVAASKDPSQSATSSLDWNTYLDGTWAFLVGHRDELEVDHARLAAETGAGNALNASALAGLSRCFGQPYRIAYSAACRTAR